MFVDQGFWFRVAGSGSVALGPWFVQRSSKRLAESVSRVRILFTPTLSININVLCDFPCIYQGFSRYCLGMF